MGAEQRCHGCCQEIAEPDPDHFRRMAHQQGALLKVRVFETITNPCAEAWDQTAGSDARARPKSRTCAGPGNSAANFATSLCERF